MRNEVAYHNKKLFSTAKNAGVSNFGTFNNEGYKGLYGMPLSEIEKKKGVKKGSLLDHAGSTELATNLFRIAQTDDKIKKDNIKGQREANKTHNEVGKKVRKIIKEIGGEMPENLPIEEKIKLNKSNKNNLLKLK